MDTTLQVRVEKELVERVKELAARNGHTLSWIVRRALEAYAGVPGESLPAGRPKGSPRQRPAEPESKRPTATELAALINTVKPGAVTTGRAMLSEEPRGEEEYSQVREDDDDFSTY